MSTYAYEVKPSTTYLNKAHFPTILQLIKEEVSRDQWGHYGWRNRVLDADSLEEVAKVFEIGLEETEDDFCQPVIDGVYVSDFFIYLLDIVAPYMSDGKIIVEVGFEKMVYEFSNGKAKVYYMD